MYYVFKGCGELVKECRTYEEALEYVNAHGAEDMWISTDEEE